MPERVEWTMKPSASVTTPTTLPGTSSIRGGGGLVERGDALVDDVVARRGVQHRPGELLHHELAALEQERVLGAFGSAEVVPLAQLALPALVERRGGVARH